MHSAENLRDNFVSPIRNNKHLKLGLRYDEIPRISIDKKYKNNRMNLFCNVMEKTIKYYKIESDKRNMNELINEENLKLKNYMNNMNKFMQIKGNIYEKYPNLIDFQNMEKLKENNLILSNNRYMGEKYDPLNYT